MTSPSLKNLKQTTKTITKITTKITTRTKTRINDLVALGIIQKKDCSVKQSFFLDLHCEAVFLDLHCEAVFFSDWICEAVFFYRQTTPRPPTATLYHPVFHTDTPPPAKPRPPSPHLPHPRPTTLSHLISHILAPRLEHCRTPAHPFFDRPSPHHVHLQPLYNCHNASFTTATPFLSLHNALIRPPQFRPAEPTTQYR